MAVWVHALQALSILWNPLWDISSFASTVVASFPMIVVGRMLLHSSFGWNRTTSLIFPAGEVMYVRLIRLPLVSLFGSTCDAEFGLDPSMAEDRDGPTWNIMYVPYSIHSIYSSISVFFGTGSSPQLPCLQLLQIAMPCFTLPERLLTRYLLIIFFDLLASYLQ